MPDVQSLKEVAAVSQPGLPSIRPPFDLDEIRRRIPLFGTAIPLNSCSQGPLMASTRDAATEFLDSWDRRGMDWAAWIAEVETARALFARLINASLDEVAVTTSVSAAAASVASALDFSAHRNRILISDAEFPTVAHVWQAFGKYGAKVDWVPSISGEIDIEEYPRRLGPHTALVSACHASYKNGSRQDLAKISQWAHEAGALVFADAYQTVGVEPVDVKDLGIDFLAAGCLKYLMGTAGIAFLYIRRELLENLEPAVTGWFGRHDPFSFQLTPVDWSDSARRFDTGTPAVLNAYLARAGMEAVSEVGLEAITGWTRTLSEHLLHGLEERGLEVLGPRDWRRKTPLTAILCPDAAKVEALLKGRGILASARGDALRLAPHFFNAIEDIDQALDTLVEILEGL